MIGAAARQRFAQFARPAISTTTGAALLSLALYLATIVLVHVDGAFNFRWFAFALWLLSLAAIPAALAWEQRSGIRCELAIRLRQPRRLLPAGLLLVLALAFSFALLVQYPYVAIYDQVRDGGLNAREIATGEIKDIFGYGRYGSHGLIIPTVASFFYHLFGSTVLTYRVPAALLAVLDVGLIYLLLRRAAGRIAGLFAGLCLLILPLHLFYARTELVVIFSSVFMTVVLLILQRFLANRSRGDYLLLGVTLGFISNFHGSILTIALFTLALVLAITAFACLRQRPRAPLVLGAALMLLFYVVGFGPKLLFTSPSTFLHTNESFTTAADQTRDQPAPLGDTLGKFTNHPETLGKNYLKSVLVYVHEPTITTHFLDWKPLLDPALSVLFLLGLVAAIVRPRAAIMWLIALYAFVIPFTNSAMTDSLNGDNRLIPAIPVAAALTGYGAAVLIGLLRRSVLLIGPPEDDRRERSAVPGAAPSGSGKSTVPLRYAALAFGGLAAVYLLVQGIQFYTGQTASKGYTADDYLSMHAIYFIRSNSAYRHAPLVCMAVTPERFAYFGDDGNRLLVSEQYEYFLPGQTVHIYSNPDVAAGEIYLSTVCDANTGHHFAEHDYCRTARRFTCPQAGELKLYAEEPGVAARPAEGLAFLGLAWSIDPKPMYIP